MTTIHHIETDEERKERQARHEAFWNRPEGEVWRELTLAEEDLPPYRRGGPHRWFRSANIIDLVKIRKARARR
jgi:hypothetical protein